MGHTDLQHYRELVAEQHAEIERLNRQLVSDINAETEIDRLETEIEQLRWAKAKSDGDLADANAEIERLHNVIIRGLAGVELSEENDRLIAEIEWLRANEKAQMDGALALLAADKNLRDEIERLRAALTDIATGTCSASGAAGIAKDALAGKSQAEWS